jgi:hypothetical protein
MNLPYGCCCCNDGVNEVSEAARGVDDAAIESLAIADVTKDAPVPVAPELAYERVFQRLSFLKHLLSLLPLRLLTLRVG